MARGPLRTAAEQHMSPDQLDDSPDQLDDSPDQLDDELIEGSDGTVSQDAETVSQDAETGEEEQPQEPLQLTVDVESPSACERHVTVTVAREDIERYFDDAFSEMMPSANVPGFRPGRAPRKLVENRYRKEVVEQVKSSILMDSMSQISKEYNFTPISEPDFELEAVEVPDDGPMTFEFDLEVRPEFELPDWKGLTIQRPVREYNEKDIDKRLDKILVPHGQLVPHEGKAQAGDYVSLNITCTHEGEEVASVREEVVRICPILSFRDGKIEIFDKLMVGASAGDVRETEFELSGDAPNQKLRGKTVSVGLEILEVKKLELPELTPELLENMGEFDSERALRQAVQQDLQRQLFYYQAQKIRQQIASALTASADWELPPGLLERQSERELERRSLELQRSGFSDSEIRARENELRQNSTSSTATALKEHFILEQIAEEENVETDNQDYDDEIALIASQSGESERRVRAKIEKRNLMDVLRNQIIERKVIELVRSHANFKDIPFKQDELDKQGVEAIDMAASGGKRGASIPDATQEATAKS